MTIPACLLSAYLEPESVAPIEIRAMGGKPQGYISAEEARELASVDAIEGIGSRSRLKHVRRLMTKDEAESRLAEQAHVIRRGRTRSALDLLMRMCAARKFIKREQLMETDPLTGFEVRSGRWAWQHKTV